MAKQISKWESDDGQLFDTEIEVLRYENAKLHESVRQAMARAVRPRSTSRDEPASGYGSSGGGGHD